MKHEIEVTEKKPPVNVGDILTVVPTGIADKDPYYIHHGFIIFIKKLPKEKIENNINIKITSIKKTFAFSDYKSDAL